MTTGVPGIYFGQGIPAVLYSVDTIKPPADPEGFVASWGFPSRRDEFEAATMDTALWNIRSEYKEGQDCAVTKVSNVTIETVAGASGTGQACRMRAAREPSGDAARPWTSCYIDTIGKFHPRYGRWEIRAKLPLSKGTSRGMWPGLWLRDRTGGGECDFMESIGTPNNHPEYYPTTFGRHSASLYAQTGVSSSNYWSQVFNDLDVADDQFHTFAVEWTPNKFVYLHDDRVIATRIDSWIDTAFPGGANTRIDLFIGSNWSGFPYPADPLSSVTAEMTASPSYMYLDYYRYWSYTP